MSFSRCLAAWEDHLGPLEQYMNAEMLVNLGKVDKQCLKAIREYFMKIREKYQLKDSKSSLAISKIYSESGAYWRYSFSEKVIKNCLFVFNDYRRSWRPPRDVDNIIIRPVSYKKTWDGWRIYGWVISDANIPYRYPTWFLCDNRRQPSDERIIQIIPWR